VLAWLVACSPVPLVDDVRAVCEMDPERPLPSWDASGDGPMKMSEACAAALGEVVSLDWGSFHQAPHVVEYPETQVDVLLWGLYTLIASDLGPSEAFAQTMAEGELLGKDGGFSGARPDDDATYWMVGYLRRHTRRLRWAEEEGCAMRRDRKTGDILVCGEFDAWSAIAASGFLHEAGHANGPPHVEVSGAYLELFDEDLTGTYALQVRWLEQWYDRYEGHQDLLHDRYRDLIFPCYRILDRTGFEPCAGY
jgi:hypothetical protein